MRDLYIAVLLYQIEYLYIIRTTELLGLQTDVFNFDESPAKSTKKSKSDESTFEKEAQAKKRRVRRMEALYKLSA